MKSIIKIDADNVMVVAQKMISESKKSLDLTMILHDEVHKPVFEITTLIKQKIKDDIRVRRVAFGTEKDFAVSMRLYKDVLSYKNFTFILSAGRIFGPRILIADKKKMLFGIYTSKFCKEVFFSENKELIDVFLNYFETIFIQNQNK